MHSFEYYYDNIIKYELLTKFNYKNLNQIPNIKSIHLNFGIKQVELKILLPCLISLQLITLQTPFITQSNKHNMSLKIRKGDPVGCKIILRKKILHSFISKLILIVLPKIDNFEGFRAKINNCFAFHIKDILIFSEIANHYTLFERMPILDISFKTNSQTRNELKALLSAYKFPIKD